MRSLGKDNEEKVSKVYHASYSAKAQGKKKKKKRKLLELALLSCPQRE